MAAFAQRIRVYYEDTDAGGIVYHANYLRFFERVRTDWLRALGARHPELRAREGLILVVRDLQLDYHLPARLDDELEVDVEVTEVRRATLRLRQTARLAGEARPLVGAALRVAALNPDTGRPVALPAWLIDRCRQAMTHCATETEPSR